MSRLISLRVARQLVELLAVIGQTYRRQNHPECLTRNEARYLNRLSSPPRKRGSRATVRTLRPLGSRFRGNDG